MATSYVSKVVAVLSSRVDDHKSGRDYEVGMVDNTA